MLKALIVDDEKKSREILRILLTEFCENVQVVGVSGSIVEAVGLIKKYKPNIVFLDIRMSGETGFDLFGHFDQATFDVVIVTAYSEYALTAFKFSAMDYLLKPVDIDSVKQAIGKVEKKQKLTELAQKKIEAFMHNMNQTCAQDFKIALPTSRGLVFVKLKEILYCVGQNNYTEFFIKEKQNIIVSKTIKEYELLLSGHNFFRIHQSYLINLGEVQEYVRGEGGYVIMNNNASLDVSRRRKEAFLRKIYVLNK